MTEKNKRPVIPSFIWKILDEARHEYPIVEMNKEPIPTHFDVWLSAIEAISDKLKELEIWESKKKFVGLRKLLCKITVGPFCRGNYCRKCPWRWWK